MGTPNTLGSFRTDHKIMEVGDYIAFKYTTTAEGSPGAITELGVDLATAQGNELPIGALSLPNGYAYALKVAPGLLISDRVVQTGVLYSALNTRGLIHGRPYVGARNFIASFWQYGTVGGDVFSCRYDNRWSMDYNAATERWLKFDMLKPIKGDLVTSWGTGEGYNPPSSLKLYTSETGSFTGEEVLQSSSTDYSVSSPHKNLVNTMSTSARYFKIQGTWNSGQASNLTQAFFTNTKDILTIRSLTGGVAYLGSDGKPSSVYAGLGNWPTSNEWDKYIVSSDLNGKIVAGADDVWHWNTAASWCKEVPIMALTRSTDSLVADIDCRVCRGEMYGNIPGAKLTVGSFRAVDSGSPDRSTIGFRPVLEFIDPASNASSLWA